jgi:hypothetical protein
VFFVFACLFFRRGRAAQPRKITENL